MQVVDALGTFLSRFYHRDHEILPSIPISDKVRRRGDQILAESLLSQLEVLPPAALILGVTNKDVYVNDSRYVFAAPKVEKRAVILSLKWLLGAKESEVTRLRRVLTIGAMQSSHVFGIRDCKGFLCGMNPSGSLAMQDATPLYFCPECEQKIWWVCDCDPTQRYTALIEFATAHGLTTEATYWEKCLTAIESGE
jgi:predicted Zn-dependent protease